MTEAQKEDTHCTSEGAHIAHKTMLKLNHLLL